jgi:hypothetical protein
MRILQKARSLDANSSLCDQTTRIFKVLQERTITMRDETVQDLIKRLGEISDIIEKDDTMSSETRDVILDRLDEIDTILNMKGKSEIEFYRDVVSPQD